MKRFRVLRASHSVPRIHEVFGCYVPIFVNWFGLLHKDRSDYQPYKRAWATVARAILYNPECNFIALSILDRGPTVPGGSQKLNYLDELPNLMLFGSSHGHIPIPLVRKDSCSMQHLPTRYYVACMGQHGFARSVVLEALRTDAFLSALADSPTWPREDLVFTGLAPGGRTGFQRMAAESKFCIVTARLARSAFPKP